jgi:phosphatidylglycerophosphatase A
MAQQNNINYLNIIKNPVHFLAFGLGLGFLPLAPGTFGTILGVVLYIASYYLGINLLLLAILSFILGIYLCGRTARDINYHDHPGIVWDEVAGYLITMLFVPYTYINILLGFVLFRLFDIVKPWPIKVIDQKITGGLGIMLDDVLAAIFANMVLNLILYLGFI